MVSCAPFQSAYCRYRDATASVALPDIGGQRGEGEQRQSSRQQTRHQLPMLTLPDAIQWTAVTSEAVCGALLGGPSRLSSEKMVVTDCCVASELA